MFSRGRGLRPARATYIDRTKEEPVVKQILDGLRAHGFEAHRVKERISVCWRCKGFIGQPGEKGIPDLIGWMPRNSNAERYSPIPLYIEVKRPKGGVKREEQIAFIERARAAGAIACFARSWDDVADEFKRHGIVVGR